MLAEDDQPVDLSPSRMADPRSFQDLAATDSEEAHAPGCASAVQWIPRSLLPLARAAFSTLLRRIVSNQDATADECGVIGIALFATDGLGTNRNAGAKVGIRKHRSLARQLRLITECAFATLRAAAVCRARSRTDIAPPPPRGTPPDDDLPPPATPGPPTRIKRRFQKLVACGELRKAANALTPEEPAPFTEDTFSVLRSLHPPLPGAFPDDIMNMVVEDPVQVSMKTLRNAIKKMRYHRPKPFVASSLVPSLFSSPATLFYSPRAKRKE